MHAGLYHRQSTIHATSGRRCTGAGAPPFCFIPRHLSPRSQQHSNREMIGPSCALRVAGPRGQWPAPLNWAESDLHVSNQRSSTIAARRSVRADGRALRGFLGRILLKFDQSDRYEIHGWHIRVCGRLCGHREGTRTGRMFHLARLSHIVDYEMTLISSMHTISTS
jgi:hypothetical protein